MTWMEGAQWTLVIESLAVMIACGSVLLMSITIRRSVSSAENAINRILSVAEKLDRGANTKRDM